MSKRDFAKQLEPELEMTPTDLEGEENVARLPSEFSAEPLPLARATAGVQYDQRILRSLRRIIRSVELYSRQLAVNNRITAPQLVCLLAVINQGPMTATAISREVHLSASTVVGILDRLEEKGWITRVRDREDRRVVLVSATAEGVALARQAPSPLQRALANALNALPELEQATIALSLERVVALMEVRVIDTPSIPTSGPHDSTAA